MLLGQICSCKMWFSNTSPKLHQSPISKLKLNQNKKLVLDTSNTLCLVTAGWQVEVQVRVGFVCIFEQQFAVIFYQSHGAALSNHVQEKSGKLSPSILRVAHVGSESTGCCWCLRNGLILLKG